jgi:hypothetical protein
VARVAAVGAQQQALELQAPQVLLA